MKSSLALMLFISTAVFAQQKGSFTDPRDNKTYKTVQIGEQTWMAENVDYAGEKREIGACRNKKPENCKKYGAYYNWEEAKKVCPPGWHLPSNEEWNVLVNFAGGIENAGKKLKANKNWYKINFEKKFSKEPDNGTDDYGFEALPGGFNASCDVDEFAKGGETGCWWSLTEGAYYNRTGAYHLLIGQGFVYMGVWDKLNEYSVRCIQDNIAKEE